MTRIRLFCRTAENLILSDDVLSLLGINWPEFQLRAQQWLQANPSHQQSNALREFSIKFDRHGADVKILRNLFMTIAGSSKPWEVAVGQALARLDGNALASPGSLAQMIGEKAVKHLFHNSAGQ